MDRREALKRSSLILGYAVTAGTATAVLNGCKAEPSLDWSPKNLNIDQVNLVSEICELIIPKTDTPGAKDVGLDRFVDSMLDSYSPEERNDFFSSIQQFDDVAQSLNSKNFVDCSDEERVKVMDALVKEFKTGKKPSAFWTMRQITVVGFCTSEIGATQFLKHDPVPGPFQGCVDYDTIGGTWAI